MRILGIDYGDVRTGFAVSDPTETIAGAIGTYECMSMRAAIDCAQKIASDHGAQLIVIGLPKNMDGSEGERAEKTRAFGNVLARVTGLNVEYRDERLTTVSAERSLIDGGMRREKRKAVIDTVAAQMILQSYLEYNRNKNRSE